MTTARKQQILDALSGLGALLAGMGALPVDSAHLPMPPEWRPYIISVGFFAVTAGKWVRWISDIFSKWQPPNDP